MTTIDRRAHRRVKTTRKVQLQVRNGGEEFSTLLVDMDSLSARGISITSSTPLPDHSSEIVLQITLPDHESMVETQVEQIWHVPDIVSGFSKYGLLFSNLRSVDYQAIQFYLRSHDIDAGSGSRRGRERRSPRTSNPSERRSTDRRWTLPTYMLYIDGRDVDTGVYEYFPYADKAIEDPKGTSEVMLRIKNGEMPPETKDYIYARCCVGTDEHNQQAMESAAAAFKQFAIFPMSKRMKIFDDIHNLLLKHKEILLQYFIAEGHPRQLGEWEFSGMLQAFKAETVEFYKTEVAKNRKVHGGEINMLIRKPDGVVCVSPPRNAACSNSLTGALSLLGGNTLLVKPPLTLPVATMHMWRYVVDEALKRNGAPRGTLNIVVGNTARYISQWTHSPLVNDIVYFGESNRGLEIGNKIYAAGKKPILELSGKDIMLVWQDGDLEAASDSLVDCFLGSTQICMVPKMALIHEAVYDKFESIFLEKVKKLKVGLPSDPVTCLSPVSKIGTFFTFLEEGLAKGGTLVHGGRRLNHRGEPDGKGLYVEPTVLRLDDNLPIHDLKCVQEEIFFPLLPLVKMTRTPVEREQKSLNHNEVIFHKMVALTAKNAYGLRISVWCKSASWVRKFIRAVNNSGLLRINCRHVDFSTYLATHGGPGKTGGPFGELNYFWQKTTHLQGISIRR